MCSPTNVFEYTCSSSSRSHSRVFTQLFDFKLTQVSLFGVHQPETPLILLTLPSDRVR